MRMPALMYPSRTLADALLGVSELQLVELVPCLRLSKSIGADSAQLNGAAVGGARSRRHA